MLHKDDFNHWTARGDDPDRIETGSDFQPKFDADGLIPAIVVDETTSDVVMFAWMNAEALARTLRMREAHFWSRSRQRIWQKGEESGNRLLVTSVATDCDQDAILIRARISGAGAACHTGRHSCFYREVDLDSSGRPFSLRHSPG